MKPPIEFYFDFSSPYGYLAAQRIDALAAKHGRTVEWHPIMLGAVFKATGMAPLPQVPIKGPYSMRDFPRSARFHGIAYRQPSTFPISTLHAARAYYWLGARDRDKALALARALYKAYFVDDVNISDAENVLKVAAALGIDPEALRAGIGDPDIKEKTRVETDSAIAKGVFGSPYVVVDGEPFWGMDRLDQVERWLQGPF